MTAIEFIGFIITLGLTASLFAKKARQDRLRAENPEEFDAEEERKYQELQKLLGVRQEEFELPIPKAAPPPPPPRVKGKPKRTMGEGYDFKTDLVKYEKTHGVESREFETRIQDVEFRELGLDVVSDDMFLEHLPDEEEPSKLQRWMTNTDIEQVIVFSELLKAPKGYQNLSHFHDDLR